MMEHYTTTPPRRRRRRRRVAPIVWLLPILVVILTVSVVLVVRSFRADTEPPPVDPHEGQVYVNDGANMVWLTPIEGIAVNPLLRSDFITLDGHPHYMGTDFTVERGVDLSTYQAGVDWAKAAKEIADGLHLSWIRQWWEFNGGALVMLGVKLRENALILNTPIFQLQKEQPYHIVTIKRMGETIIPSGSDELEAGDIVYFMTSKRSLPYIRKITGKEEHATIRNIMIMGGSRIAMRAAQLVSDAMSVKIIDNDINRCHWLTDLVDDNVMIINGDGRDYKLLEEEGINEVDAFVALTDNSETNILACLSAKRMGVFKTIAEVENIDYISMAESLDIGAVINKKKIAASYIYQLLLDADVENVKCLTFANADVAEFVVKEGARVTRSQVKDLTLPKGVTIGGLVRKDEGILVTGDTQIQTGDHVVVFCLSSMIKRIEKYFN